MESGRKQNSTFKVLGGNKTPRILYHAKTSSITESETETLTDKGKLKECSVSRPGIKALLKKVQQSKGSDMRGEVGW